VELQEWLFLILGTAIVGLVIHGFWVKYYGSDRLPLKLDKQFVSDRSDLSPDEALQQFKAELPNGGARVVKVGDSSIPVGDHNRPSSATSVDQNLDHQGAGSGNQDKDVKFAKDAPEPVEAEGPFIEDNVASRGSAPQITSDAAKDDDVETDTDLGTSFEAKPELFMVLNVLGSIQGQALLEGLMALEFEYGDKSIFHRLGPTGAPVMSVANAVEPGTFDLATIDQLETPGVIFFMGAHEVPDPVAGFEAMLQSAVYLAEELGATLCDDRRSAVTEQTLEHLRQQLQTYQFNQSR